MKFEIFRKERKMSAGRSGSAAQATAGPATELMAQVARFHRAVG